NALTRREALVDDRLRERARLTGAPADDVQLVFSEEVGRGEQVGDELGGRVDARGRRKPAAFGDVAFAGDAEIWRTLGVHIPRMSYRPDRRKCLVAFASREGTLVSEGGPVLGQKPIAREERDDAP